ncbi:ankyrin repeat domain-containing protein [Chryseobacterium sp. Y16C]|nr:ankyrin repeat domain-containing protein [Chryseobacterium sp. Y16C]UMQ42029.1 ankyrin repeat domain-containing protein [Chryseobacterium sp. Y16C]
MLFLSIKHDKKNILEYLLNHEVDLNKECGNQTPLMVAARYGKLDFAKLLLKKANRNAKNEKGETAKEFAVQYNHPEMTSILK